MLHGGAMLRIEIQGSPDTLILKLEGRLMSHDAEHTRTLVRHCHQGMRLVVNLTEVTFIDCDGEAVLSFFGLCGEQFVAHTSLSLDARERLQLRLARGGQQETAAAPGPRQSGSGRRAHTRQ